MEWLKYKLNKKFDMGDVEELHYCLKMKFERDKVKHTITMSQKTYIKGMLKRFYIEKCKPVQTPLDMNSNLLKFWKEVFKKFQREIENFLYTIMAIGSLAYTMVGSQGDLAFAMSKVNQIILRLGLTQ